MKKVIGVLLAVFLLIFSSNALAIDLAGKFAFTVKGGMGLPILDFADKFKVDANVGYGFGMNGEYFITDKIALGADFDYNRFSEGSSGYISLELINFGVFAKYMILTRANTAFYIKLGSGLYKPKESWEFSYFVDYNSLSYGMKFGFGGGGGIMFEVSDFILLSGEVMFQDALVKEAKSDRKFQIVDDYGDTRIDSIPFKADLQYFQIHFGITLLIGGN